MKKTIALIIVTATSLIMCTSPNVPVNETIHDCTIPEEYGDTLVTGETIYWDCDWHASYMAGNVHVIRNDKGVVKMIYRNLSK